MDINKIKYVLVRSVYGDCVEPAISDDALFNEFNLTERTEICAKCTYYERLVQTIKDEEKDWLFELFNYDLNAIYIVYNLIKTAPFYESVISMSRNDKKDITNTTKMSDLDKKRYVTARDNLVNNFINCSYDLEIISKTFNDVTKTTNIKTIEYYAIDTRTNEYCDMYDVITPNKRYLDYELRKMVKEYIDSANNYDFDSTYLTYGEKRVILTLYV